MSSEQPEVETAPATDITQQATSPTPKQHVKNPKRVAAGKLVAKRTREAREEQKKAAAEAAFIIANNNAKAFASPPQPEQQAEKNSGLTLNQWIGIGGLVVSAAGLFLKRSEIMSAFEKKPPSPPPLPVEPAPKRKGLRKMDEFHN